MIEHSLLQLYGINLLDNEMLCQHSLKEHAQIPIILDILSRKNNHHLQLTGIESSAIQLAFLEGIAFQLLETTVPLALRNIEFFYLNVKQLLLAEKKPEQVAQTFFSQYATQPTLSNITLLAMNANDMTDGFLKAVQTLTANKRWRIILFNGQKDRNNLTSLRLAEPTKSQLLSLLKSYKNELETYHRVLIPEDTFASALSMAYHYLNQQHYFDRALELIDSAASRASAIEHHDTTGQYKPLVSTATLSHVLSSWTQIPLTNLHNNSFQASKCVEALGRRIFGQEAALGFIASVLQTGYIPLREKTGPLCSFLFVGPAETGKTSTAIELTEHLFGHRQALLRVNLVENYSTLADVKIISEEHSELRLAEAIQVRPYAIILLDNLNENNSSILTLFSSVFTQGYAFDTHGNRCDFKNTIIIITTTLGADRIATLMQAPTLVETNKTFDLMQLVLNEHIPEQQEHLNLQLSLQDIAEELLSTLEPIFSQAITQQLNIVPFMPLDYLALEKIMRSKIKLFAKRLELNYAIELTYTPEVIKFLAHEAFWQKPLSKSIEKILELHLYRAVANEILLHADDKHQPRRLSIQLNDEGQLLRCEAGSNLSALF